MGLANRVVPTGTARQAAEALARELAQLPQVCLRSDRLSAYEADSICRSSRRWRTSSSMACASCGRAQRRARGASPLARVATAPQMAARNDNAPLRVIQLFSSPWRVAIQTLVKPRRSRFARHRSRDTACRSGRAGWRDRCQASRRRSASRGRGWPRTLPGDAVTAGGVAKGGVVLWRGARRRGAEIDHHPAILRPHHIGIDHPLRVPCTTRARQQHGITLGVEWVGRRRIVVFAQWMPSGEVAMPIAPWVSLSEATHCSTSRSRYRSGRRWGWRRSSSHEPALPGCRRARRWASRGRWAAARSPDRWLARRRRSAVIERVEIHHPRAIGLHQHAGDEDGKRRVLHLAGKQDRDFAHLRPGAAIG